MTNKELLDFHKALKDVMNVQGEEKYYYAVEKNERGITKYALELSKEFRDAKKDVDPNAQESYRTDYNTVVKKYFKEDDKSQISEEEEKKFYEEISKVQEKHKEYCKAVGEAKEVEDQILSRVSEYKIHQIPLDCKPRVLTPAQFRGLRPLFFDIDFIEEESKTAKLKLVEEKK